MFTVYQENKTGYVSNRKKTDFREFIKPTAHINVRA
jgi:hypothetical protein